MRIADGEGDAADGVEWRAIRMENCTNDMDHHERRGRAGKAVGGGDAAELKVRLTVWLRALRRVLR